MQTSGSMNSIVSSSFPWMQSTGHTSTHDLSFVPMHGSVMMYAMAKEGLRGRPGRSYRQKPEAPAGEDGRFRFRWYGASVRRPAPTDRAEDEQQDHRTDERHDDAPQVQPGQ